MTVRSNGLTASSYAPVADLEPQVAASLLDDLKAQGVAAYTTPVASSTAAGFDRPEFRLGVKDRLYVDAAASARVRELISAHDPELLVDNEDLTWAQLVAGFDRPYDDPVAPWPAEEDLSPPDERPAPAREPGHEEAGRSRAYPFRSHLPRHETSGEPPRVEPGPDGEMDDDDFLASTSKVRAHDDEADRFVPDPPPPLPRLAPYKQLAWFGLIGGPLILLIAVLANIQLPGWVLLFSILGFVGGFVTLVATMGDHTDGDWGSGDGAVV